MSKKRNRACVCGHFAFGEQLLNGQTVKTKIITAELENRFGNEEIEKLDTHGGKKAFLFLPFRLLAALKRCQNLIILPAQNGLRVIAPLLALENKLFHRKLHYVVIGGWLPEFLNEHPGLAKALKAFACIYVETKAMKTALEKAGFTNVTVMPNCKNLQILTEEELVYTTSEPYKLCTFSRVMKEKGIEDAIHAVNAVNARYGRTVFSLNIYGQVEPDQTAWFDALQKNFPAHIRYEGPVPFDKSTEVLKDHYALLFPTCYEGEGFAGTLIDAMAAGVPVIASDWRYNCEIVVEGETGTVYPTGDPAALIDRLVTCYENQKMWTAMKKTCVHKAAAYLPQAVVGTLADEL